MNFITFCYQGFFVNRVVLKRFALDTDQLRIALHNSEHIAVKQSSGKVLRGTGNELNLQAVPEHSRFLNSSKIFTRIWSC